MCDDSALYRRHILFCGIYIIGIKDKRNDMKKNVVNVIVMDFFDGEYTKNGFQSLQVRTIYYLGYNIKVPYSCTSAKKLKTKLKSQSLTNVEPTST